MDSDSGNSSQHEFATDDPYYIQMKPVLKILWNNGISNKPPSERYDAFQARLCIAWLLQHYWKQSDVLVNLTEEMGAYDSINFKQSSENMMDWYENSSDELDIYIRLFLSQQL